MNQNPLRDITCTDCQTCMEEYIAGDLDTDTESAIASHLSTCDTCSHELHLAQAIDTVLDDLPKPTSPPDILREVTAYVRATSPQQWLDASDWSIYLTFSGITHAYSYSSR